LLKAENGNQRLAHQKECSRRFGEKIPSIASRLVGALFMLIILMVIGGEMGRCGQSKVAEKAAEPKVTEASLS
jgi:hypothetical protein